MKDFTLKLSESPSTVESISAIGEQSLQEIARYGARQMLKLALEAEIKDFIGTHNHLVDSEGKHEIVRNGYHQERKIQTGVGEIRVSVPRSRDRGKDREGEEKIMFQSGLIPPYLRRTRELRDFIPFLYLKGISTGDFSEVLSRLLGHNVSFSASSVVNLKKQWEDEYEEWSRRDLTDKRYIYWWVDGIYFNVRLGDDKRHCVLVVMGATEEGRKELIAVEMGYRESELSWKNILLDLKARGLEQGPKLAIGDGALGFWKAISQIYVSA